MKVLSLAKESFRLNLEHGLSNLLGGSPVSVAIQARIHSAPPNDIPRKTIVQIILLFGWRSAAGKWIIATKKTDLQKEARRCIFSAIKP
jgi:hypothetical protein